MLGEQPRGAVDVERLLGGLRQLGERGREPLEERALGRRQRRVGEPGAQRAGAEALAHQRLVEVGGGPVREARVDRALVGEDALGDAARRRDDHDHQHLRLEQQDLDVADRRGVDRRRGDDREQVGDLRQRLRGEPHRLVDLAPGEREPERLALLGRRGQEPVHVVAVAAVGRHAAGRCVRVREQPALLEDGELVADRRGAGDHVRIGCERLGADGLAGGREPVDHLREQQLLAWREHATESRSPPTRPARPSAPLRRARSRPRRGGRPACRPASPPRRRPRSRRRGPRARWTSRRAPARAGPCPGTGRRGA